jgi:hypothetical protein
MTDASVWIVNWAGPYAGPMRHRNMRSTRHPTIMGREIVGAAMVVINSGNCSAAIWSSCGRTAG